MEYEYVSKAEYQPVREKLEKIIWNVHHYMSANYGVTFQHRLIGSGKRHLITRVKNGNKGFDFDYNFIVSDSIARSWCPKELKTCFIDALSKTIRGTIYENPNDSTSAITLKVVDRKNKIIIHSCDFAIIYNELNDAKNEYYCLINHKPFGRYSFEKRNHSKNIDDKVDRIRQENGGWEMIKTEYLKLKNNNQDENKHSYSLYVEAVNNVYNHLFNQGLGLCVGWQTSPFFK